ncbi:SDR family NAD(P)-dependent oxidoreductase [Pontibacillus salicampi]|uniref:SDR family NAD(P)-dependent oxidoreductase n=1 Tax=Pontibacillus salicampi TaxID=1449801 RepID=A0ABV6LMF4_9BACI
MKKALVIGATGGMGSALVKELVDRGITVVAFARDNKKLNTLGAYHDSIILQQGDAFRYADVKKAASNVDVIFHAVNLPYASWEQDQERLMDTILKVGKESSCKLAMVDNIYAYHRNSINPVTEGADKEPHTKKGKIRLRLEEKIKQSTVPYLICHFPDFFGPNANSSLLHYTLSTMKKNTTARFVGNQDVNREFIYTIDGARDMVALSLLEDTYYQNWNIRGNGVVRGEELVEIMKEVTGYTNRVGTVHKSMVRLIGVVDKQMREYVEMFYLNEQPLILSGAKVEERLGKRERVSYQEGIEEMARCM